MLLDHTKFIVKSKGKLLSSKKSYEIVDAESGKVVGTAKDTTGFVANLLGATEVEVRDSAGDKLLFKVSRSGLLIKKDQVTNPDGQVIGRYKAKMLSIAGGFHVYDKDGKHLAEIQGKMLKKEYKFVTPDKSTEMGTVSSKWDGFAKEMFTDSDSYVVQVTPKFADDTTTKILILGATIVVESILKKAAKSD